MRENLHADALDLVGTWSIARVNRTRWVGTDNFNLWVLLFEVTARTGDGAAGANTCHESGDAPGGIAPYFRAGGGIMGGRIGGIGVLIGTAGTRNLISQSMSHIFIMFRRIMGDAAGADDHLSTVGSQKAALLLADLVSHHKYTVVALNGGCYRQSMSRIATGRFHNSPAGAQQPAFLTILNHGGSNAIFDAATRVKHFHFH